MMMIQASSTSTLIDDGAIEAFWRWWWWQRYGDDGEVLNEDIFEKCEDNVGDIHGEEENDDDDDPIASHDIVER